MINKKDNEQMENYLTKLAQAQTNICVVEKPITNADRIRSMTNAELARFFDNIEKKNYFGDYLGELGWLSWLIQEGE